jgi:hypothetical protein
LPTRAGAAGSFSLIGAGTGPASGRVGSRHPTVPMKLNDK